jgi:hypothetical protein
MPSLLEYCLVSLIRSAAHLLDSSSVLNLYMVLRVTEITQFFNVVVQNNGHSYRPMCFVLVIIFWLLMLLAIGGGCIKTEVVYLIKSDFCHAIVDFGKRLLRIATMEHTFCIFRYLLIVSMLV